MKVAGLLLAAGASKRLGRPKQLLEIGGEPLIHRAARVLIAGGCQPLMVVLGAHREQCARAVENLPLQTIFNERHSQGMGTSISTGIAHLQSQNPEIEAVIIALCDQPFLSSELIQSLIERGQNHNFSVVNCDYGASFGPPVFFTVAHFAELEQLRGESGARAIWRAHPDKTASLAFPEGATDIDTDLDWDALQRKFAVE